MGKFILELQNGYLLYVDLAILYITFLGSTTHTHSV